MSIADNIQQPYFDARLPDDSLLRLTVEQYHNMARQGILENGRPVELLEGLLVCKMTVSPAHHRTTRRLQDVLRKLVPAGYFVESPASVTLAASEPEPDAIVVRAADDDFADRHPGPRDVALVIEVSDSSLRRDQGFKKMIYAKSAISVYWIINLIDQRIEVYSNPSDLEDEPDFGDRLDFTEADEMPLVIDGREVARIPVRDILP
jgi:hypothetical protein